MSHATCSHPISAVEIRAMVPTFYNANHFSTRILCHRTTYTVWGPTKKSLDRCAPRSHSALVHDLAPPSPLLSRHTQPSMLDLGAMGEAIRHPPSSIFDVLRWRPLMISDLHHCHHPSISALLHRRPSPNFRALQSLFISAHPFLGPVDLQIFLDRQWICSCSWARLHLFTTWSFPLPKHVVEWLLP